MQITSEQRAPEMPSIIITEPAAVHLADQVELDRLPMPRQAPQERNVDRDARMLHPGDRGHVAAP